MTICGHRPRGTDLTSAIPRISSDASNSRIRIHHSDSRINFSAPAAAHLQYGYNRASQRTWRRDVLATTYGQKQKPQRRVGVLDRSTATWGAAPKAREAGLSQHTAYLYDLLGQKPRRLVGVLDRSKATWGAAPKARGAGLSQILQSAKGLLNLNQTAVGGVPERQEDWTYDQLGNRLKHEVSLPIPHSEISTPHSEIRTHNNLNEIVTLNGTSEDISYDANGNMTKVPDPTDGHHLLVWDGWNRLAAVRLPDGILIQTNRYDALTRRITSNPSTTESLSAERHYYYNDQWRPLQETIGASPYPDKLYLWGVRGRDDLVLQSQGSFLYEWNVVYFLNDAMDPVALLNATGSVYRRLTYTPFGEPEWLNATFQPTPADPRLTFLFHAQFTDPETGYQNYGYRFYLPSLSRWLSPDPIGEKGGSNFYSFVENHSVNNLDQLGLTEIRIRLERTVRSSVQIYGFGTMTSSEAYVNECCGLPLGFRTVELVPDTKVDGTKTRGPIKGLFRPEYDRYDASGEDLNRVGVTSPGTMYGAAYRPLLLPGVSQQDYDTAFNREFNLHATNGENLHAGRNSGESRGCIVIGDSFQYTEYRKDYAPPGFKFGQIGSVPGFDLQTAQNLFMKFMATIACVKRLSQTPVKFNVKLSSIPPLNASGIATDPQQWLQQLNEKTQPKY